jgi:DNA-binding transcriptional MocR family regulator
LPADGGYFLFLDLRERWTGLSEDAKLQRMLDAGVIVSPGEHFGADYDGWARLCFSSEPPERVAEAARRANAL